MGDPADALRLGADRAETVAFAFDAERGALGPWILTVARNRAIDPNTVPSPLAPLYYVSSRNLVNPAITNWFDNPTDNHGAHWLCRAPSSGAAEGAAAS